MVVIIVRYVYSLFFFFRHNTAYEVRISDLISDVCSSDLRGSWALPAVQRRSQSRAGIEARLRTRVAGGHRDRHARTGIGDLFSGRQTARSADRESASGQRLPLPTSVRSEEPHLFPRDAERRRPARRAAKRRGGKEGVRKGK